MMLLKSCPRCKQGDLYLNGDDDKHCLQCGYVEYQTSNALLAIDLERFLGGNESKNAPATTGEVEEASPVAV